MGNKKFSAKRLNKAFLEAQKAVKEEFQKMKYPLNEIDFTETWDWAFSCPKCKKLTDKETCKNCGRNLSKENLTFLRLAWIEPPEPTLAYEDLISKNEEEISDIEFKKGEEILSRTYSDEKKRELPPPEELRKAIEYFKWANKLDGHYATTIIASGVCYYLLGEYFEAIQCWAQEAEEEDIDSLYYLFKVYRKVGWYYHAFGVAKTITRYPECESFMLKLSEKLEKTRSSRISPEFINDIDLLIEKELKKCSEEIFEVSGGFEPMYKPADEFFDP
jgi:tetratricopeptide (TPR) repeat protein